MFDEIAAASAALDTTLRPAVVETPLERRSAFDGGGRRLLAKLENAQVTGSFKLRGATAKLQSLSEAARARGVIAASTGNHGLAVARAAAALATAAEVFVAETADAAKVAAIRHFGAGIRPIAGDPVDAEMAARREAAADGRTYVSPYNDPVVVAGQGTIANELVRQAEPAAAVVAAVGGGGLISGIGATLRRHWPGTRLIAASAANSAAMHHSVAAGGITEVAHRPTLSDGTSGGIEPDAVTFALCRRLVDDWVLVDEDEIAAAMVGYMNEYEDQIEGSAAVALAALDQVDVAGSVIVIICGGNVAPATLAAIGLPR